ncbi:MAG: putative basic amino acid antiporter YfcC [Pseudomonadota bacterium]
MTDHGAAKPQMRAPDTLLIVFGIAFFAWIATYIVPRGAFGGGSEGFSLKTFTSSGIEGAPLFGNDEAVGLLNFFFEGLVSGDRYGATIGLMAFLLIVGGAFGVISKTRALERALTGFLNGSDQMTDWSLGVLFILFSLAGAVFGMGEEAIVFVVVLAPALLRAGYDRPTAVIVAYVATQIGFATSWMNPFSVTVAQGIAQLPALSGWEFRAAMWAVFTLLGAIWVVWRATGVRQRPQPSDASSAAPLEHLDSRLKLGHWLIIAVVTLGIIWIAWGVAVNRHYFPEISAQFFAIGLAAGFIAILFKLEGMTPNDALTGFRDGAAGLLPAVLIIGAAKGIVLLLGGDDPSSQSVLNTALHAMGGATQDLPPSVSAVGMFGLQSVINLFVVSGSGQAALTMPIMAPLADLNGLSRQIAVLSFQLGDGLTNLICPASAALMGSLAAARVEWTSWLSVIWKPLLVAMFLAVAFILTAVSIGYS